MDAVMPALQAVLDRRAVEATLMRYATGIDDADHVALRSVFSDDAVGRYGDDVVLEGGDAIVAWIASMVTAKTWQHHLLSVMSVTFDGPDRAHALTYLVSSQIGDDTPGAARRTIGRYHDTLARIDGTWRITEKVLDVGWAEDRPLSTRR
jgi:hypothetical protein